MVPVEDPNLKLRLMDILALSVNDNVKSWRLLSDGSYARVQARPGAPLIRSQQRFIEQTRDKLKGAEAAGAASGRFHLMHTRILKDAVARQTPKRREPRKTKDS